jgi:hypothetical protein
MKNKKIVLTTFLTIFFIIMFFLCYKINPSRDIPTAKILNFPQWTYKLVLYLEHFGAGLGLPFIFYHIPIFFSWIFLKKLYKNEKLKKMYKLLFGYGVILFWLVFEIWYQYIFKNRGDSFFQIFFFIIGEFVLLIYSNWFLENKNEPIPTP